MLRVRPKSSAWKTTFTRAPSLAQLGEPVTGVLRPGAVGIALLHRFPRCNGLGLVTLLHACESDVVERFRRIQPVRKVAYDPAEDRLCFGPALRPEVGDGFEVPGVDRRRRERCFALHRLEVRAGLVVLAHVEARQTLPIERL